MILTYALRATRDAVTPTDEPPTRTPMDHIVDAKQAVTRDR